MDWKQVVGEARRRGGQVLELLKETAFELSWDARDAAKTGFGVPKLASSVASLGVATVAAAGAASLAFDFAGKVWGQKDCATCNGWEGLRCQICRGGGKVQYMIDESTLTKAERSSSQSIATAALEGRASVDYLAPNMNGDLPFPFIDCPQCDGTGVSKCPACHGDAWVPKFSMAKALNAPWLAWDAYRKIQPSSERNQARATMATLAGHDLFEDDEIKGDALYNDELNQAAREKDKDKLEYNIIREQVARREPGWERMQEMLLMKDPLRAAQDPVIETDPPYYKAKMKILSEVGNLAVPPRPADWLDMRKPLSEADWSKEELQDPNKRSEMKVLLDGQEEFFNKLLDRSWENHWRTQKFEEVKHDMIVSYECEKDGRYQKPAEPEAKQKEPVPSSSASRKEQTKQATGKKVVDTKRRPEEDRKKRERQERSERMARQAADREAALSRAKASRESRDGQ